MKMVEGIDRSALVALLDSVGEEFVGELIDTFADEAPGLVEEMRRALSASDADRFRRAAHSLKSNAHTFGVTRLAELTRELETMARANDLNIGGRLEALDEEYRKAITELKSLSESLQG
jgi:HPt (histidine-containing phosphotransfer) domain-containing protein